MLGALSCLRFSPRVRCLVATPGGQDLVFPHHENELAQSRAASACCSGHSHASGSEEGSAHAGAFVRYWVHNGFVNVNSEKMSKSLGNFFTIRDVSGVASAAVRATLLLRSLAPLHRCSSSTTPSACAGS